MGKQKNPLENYNATKKLIGYVDRKDATQETYDQIGFMSGLEVHQQLLTDKKLFCNCPAHVFNKSDDYDAEVIRHMRPTLSELGEYDGTALMEFRTRKEIVYRVKEETCCTYEVDDTPPFPINKEALNIALEISLLSKFNIVGEVHITRKQYLDGSIPTGFQRTAILGVEGEIEIKNKKIRLIQLSIEEDSCREISDIGHVRVYKTDRLGMPLIETVTYPEMVNPDEVMEACNYIRFLNRSTEKVRVGIGAGRQDVNVSCKGGTRVEIKGVARTKWIPELTHVECFRQWALLNVRKQLKENINNTDNWKISNSEINFNLFQFPCDAIKNAAAKGEKIYAVNLSGFNGILSHFTQPGKVFANEIADRLKVIACLEKPNMSHSEDLDQRISGDDLSKIKDILDAKNEDAQIIFWGPEDDIKTALETIEERCIMAFDGVPDETRKSFKDGTTIFERVLPGADRMYPDTDSAPIPLENEYIERLEKNIPQDVIDRYKIMKEWGIPEDTYTYIFRNNLFPIIEKAVNELNISPVFAGTFFGHKLKCVEGRNIKGKEFNYTLVYDLFKYLIDNNLEMQLAKRMILEIYKHPKMDFDSVLTTINFSQLNEKEILSKISFLSEKFKEVQISDKPTNDTQWVMGELKNIATGNINLTKLSQKVTEYAK